MLPQSNPKNAGESHVGGWIFKARQSELEKIRDFLGDKLWEVLTTATNKLASQNLVTPSINEKWNMALQNRDMAELGKIFHFCEPGTHDDVGRTLLIHSFIEMFEPISEINFMSSGRPRTWYSGPQDYYLRCLKRVVGEIARSLAEKHHGCYINWTIGSRWKFLPVHDSADYSRTYADIDYIYKNYHDHLLSDMRNFLKDLSHVLGFKSDVTIESASSDSGLMVADFFIGLLRKQCKCSFCQGVKKWLPGVDLHQKAGALKSQFVALEDSVLSPEAWERFSNACQQEEITNDLFLLEEIIEKGALPENPQTLRIALSMLSKELLETLLERLGDMILTEYKIRKYRNDRIGSMCDNILKLYPIAEENAAPALCVLKLQKIALRLRAELRIHSGQQVDEAGKIYDLFVNRHASRLYNSPITAYIDTLESKLVRWQGLFNNLEFESIETAIREDHYIYEKLVNAIPIKSSTDVLMAKLKGTLGQAYGFIGDLHQDTEYLQMSKILLEEDLALCTPQTSEWNQVHNFLLTLAWVMEDMDLIQKYWILRNGAAWKPQLLNKDEYLNLANKGHDDCVYTYLNHLRILVLHCKQNGFSTFLRSNLEAHLNAGYEVKGYPLFMLAKWNLYLAKMAGIRISNEIKNNVEQSILNEKSNLIKLMKVPLAMIINDDDLNLRIESIIRKMENWNSEEQKIVLRFTQNINLFANKDLSNLNWKLFRLLPFYYG